MGELRQMTERAGMESFMEYIIYGEETSRIPIKDDGKDAYQKRIDAAFEELFDRLKQIFPSADRDNDALYSAGIFYDTSGNLYCNGLPCRALILRRSAGSLRQCLRQPNPVCHKKGFAET